jgi:hypothetical protein
MILTLLTFTWSDALLLTSCLWFLIVLNDRSWSSIVFEHSVVIHNIIGTILIDMIRHLTGDIINFRTLNTEWGYNLLMLYLKKIILKFYRGYQNLSGKIYKVLKLK